MGLVHALTTTERIPTAPGVAEQLHAMFAAQDAQMVAALQLARAGFEHSENKGQAVELAVRQFLEGHLPRRYGVGCGEVIDRQGNRSGQLDVVIVDSGQPFVRDRDTPGVYIAEGVTAIGEVKAALRPGDLAEIARRGPQIKRLHPLANEGDSLYSNFTDVHRFAESIAYFALALETNMKPATILAALNKIERVPAHAGGVDIPALDMLCILGHGTYFDLGDEQGSMSARTSDGRFLRGWVGPTESPGLVDLFVWLNTHLPRFVRGSSVVIPYFLPNHPDPDEQAPES